MILLIRTDEDICNAVHEWCANPDNAKSKYGDISQWAAAFNKDIDQWNVISVSSIICN